MHIYSQLVHRGAIRNQAAVRGVTDPLAFPIAQRKEVFQKTIVKILLHYQTRNHWRQLPNGL